MQTNVTERPQRNLGMELVRATEAAAMVAARYSDCGDREGANAAAAQALRALLQSIEMDGVIVVGEGERGAAPYLYHGELVGTGLPPAVDVAVDSIEGTPTRALIRPDTLALVALGERWSMWDPGPSVYVNEIVVGSAARDVIDLDRSPTENLRRIAARLDCRVRDLNVCVLDKPRHVELIAEIRAAGARVNLHQGGFIVGALQAALADSSIDVLMSIGRASEAALAAAAVKCVGGGLQIRRAPQSPQEEARVHAALGATARAILTEQDLCKSDDLFFAATAITDGALLRGVRFVRGAITTESVVMRARSGTVRFVRSIHQMDKLMRYSQIDYTGERTRATEARNANRERSDAEQNRQG